MKTLSDILKNVTTLKVIGGLDILVSKLCIDSRQIVEKSTFIAIKGNLTDGHQFINKAIQLGATCIICEEIPSEIEDNVTYIKVKDTSIAVGLIAEAFFNYPSNSLKVVGITGTNGKTTTATLLYKLFEDLGYKCGLISTVQNLIHNKALPATHTTPDAISIQSLLRKMVDEGCIYAFMEVSSHAIHQNRIVGIKFEGGIFTNITHDHLDYHKTFDEYIAVKKLFFDHLPKKAFSLTNADDKRGMVMLQNTSSSKNTYSLKMPANYKGKVLENNITGLLMNIDNHEAHFRLIGIFNAYNLLAVYGAAVLLGEDKLKVLASLSGLTGAKGRFETIVSPVERVLGIVDYAHTPDALINVLATINNLCNNGQNVITVVGCGGDRDKTKRPIMAEVVAKHSTKAIFTTDNPRSENPEQILDEMVNGLNAALKRKYLRITDRREAIKTACMLAKPADIVLVVGKGHEDYQEIKGVKHHFDDNEELKKAFELLNK